MRIAYLLQMADLATENGISKKILGQMSAWSEMGHECRWFHLGQSDDVWSPLDRIAHLNLRRGNHIRRLRRSRLLCKSIRQWAPDVIYFRYAYHSPGFRSLFTSIPAVAELNSDDTREYVLTLGRWKNLYHRLTRRRILATISGFCPVTAELAKRLESFPVPAKTIGNGINLSCTESLQIGRAHV